MVLDGDESEDENRKYLEKYHPEKLILFKDYYSEEFRIKKERDFLTKQKYLDEIFEDLRKYYVIYKEIKKTRYKMDQGKTIDQDE